MSLPALSAFLRPDDPTIGIRSRIDRLSSELSTERHADLGAALRSDFSRFSEATHALRTHDARAAVLTAGTAWGDALQGGLGAIGGGLERLSEALPALSADPSPAGARGLAAIAEGTLSDMLTALSTRSGGRSVFLNGAAAPPSLPDGAALLADLRQAAATGGPQAAVDAYFADGGPFDAALAPMPPVPPTFAPTPGHGIAFHLSASDPALRETLAAVALAALSPDLPSDTDTAALLSDRLADARTSVVRAQGRVGAVEGRLADLSDRLDADHARHSAAAADASAPDPYETATRLQAELAKLETSYAVTAKRAQLRLTDYLR